MAKKRNNAFELYNNYTKKDLTNVYKKILNEKELKNIISDNIEQTRTGDIKNPRSEANKFEKFLPDKKTVNFFKKMKKEAGPAIFREALKIQHERGNPSINVGTDKGLPFANKRNYNPFTNEVNIPADIPGVYENQIYDYLEEVSHSGQPLSEVIPRFLKNDIPGYIKAYTSKGTNKDNIYKYVYENPNTVENYTHSKIQPELEQRINSSYSWPKSKEEESDFIEYTRRSLNPQTNKEYADGGQLNNEINPKYNNYLNNNMRQYAQGGDLTRFDAGGTHEQNPNGGVPQGMAPDGSQNVVEQGESKKGNFIYSNRIELDKGLVKQFSLPGYVSGKSVSDASKAIDDKFKDRSDKYAQETKKTLLDRLANAQEYLKQQEQASIDKTNESMQANSQQIPDQMNGQIPEGMEEYAEGANSNPQEEQMEQMQGQQPMPPSPIAAFGGYQQKMYVDGGSFSAMNTLDPNAGVGYSFKPQAMTSNSPLTSPSILADGKGTTGTGTSTATTSVAPSVTTAGVVGAATGAYDLAKTAFGKPAQDTSGLAPSAKVDKAGMIGNSAMKGAAAGAALGPIGAGVGAVVGAAAGFLGAKKAREAAIENGNNFAINTNNKVSDNYAAYGGMLGITKMSHGGGLSSEDRGSDSNPYPSVSSSDFAGGNRSYPIPTQADAVDALRLAGLHGRDDVRSKVYAKYPNLKHAMGGGMNMYVLGSKMNIAPPKGIGFDSNENPFERYSNTYLPKTNMQPVEQVSPYQFNNPGNSIKNVQKIIGAKEDGDFGKDSKIALDKYRISKGIKNVGMPLQESDYAAMGLNATGNNINRNAFRQNTPQSLNFKVNSPEENFYKNKRNEDIANMYGKNKNKSNNRLDVITDNIGDMARLAPVAMNAYQLKNLEKPSGFQYQTLANRYKPQYVDEARMQSIVDQEGNNTMAAIGQMGGSEGATRNAILAMGLNKTKGLSDAYANAAAQNRAQDAQAQQFNLGVDAQNIGINNRAIDEMRADKGAYDTAKSKYLSSIGTDIGDIGKEKNASDAAIAMFGYTRKGKYVVDRDGNKVSPETLARRQADYVTYITEQNKKAKV